VEQFNKSGRVDKWFGMNWERLKPETDYNRFAGPDAAAGEAPGRKQGLSFPHPTTGGKVAVGPEYYEAVETSPLGNELLFGLAKTAGTSGGLRTDRTSDLLCVSFSSNDLIGHYWGPDSHEVMDITLRSDRLVGEFLKFLDETVGPNQYVVVITADHGVCPIPEQKHLPTAARVKTTEAISSLAAALDEKFGPGPTGPTRWLEATDFADRIWPWVLSGREGAPARGPHPAVQRSLRVPWGGAGDPTVHPLRVPPQADRGNPPAVGAGPRGGGARRVRAGEVGVPPGPLWGCDRRG